MEFNVLVLTGYIVSVFCYAIPVILLLLLRLKGEKQIGNALIGICVFVNFFVLGYLVLICNLLGSRIPFLARLIDQPVSNVFFLSIVGGLICEAGRYLGIRYVLGSNPKWQDAAGLGLGYGLASSFGLITEAVTTMMIVNYVMVTVGGGSKDEYYSLMYESGYTWKQAADLLTQVQGIQFLHGFVYAFQILMLVTVSVAASILVLGAVRKNTWFASFPVLGIWLAVATHFLADGVPVILSRLLKLPPILVILYMLAVTVAAGWFILFSLRKYPNEGIRAALADLKKKPYEKKRKSSDEERSVSISEMATKKTAEINSDETKK